jgi:hypothetical protein
MSKPFVPGSNIIPPTDPDVKLPADALTMPHSAMPVKTLPKPDAIIDSGSAPASE